MQLQCLYYLAEKVGDDSVLTDIPEVPRSDSLVRFTVAVLASAVCGAGLVSLAACSALQPVADRQSLNAHAWDECCCWGSCCPTARSLHLRLHPSHSRPLPLPNPPQKRPRPPTQKQAPAPPLYSAALARPRRILGGNVRRGGGALSPRTTVSAAGGPHRQQPWQMLLPGGAPVGALTPEHCRHQVMADLVYLFK